MTTAVATTTASPSDSMSCTATAVPQGGCGRVGQVVGEEDGGQETSRVLHQSGYDASARNPGAHHVLQTNALDGKEDGLRGGKKRREGPEQRRGGQCRLPSCLAAFVEVPPDQGFAPPRVTGRWSFAHFEKRRTGLLLRR